MEEKMIIVRRGNVVLDVPEIDRQSYLDKGYDVIDSAGRVVERCTPTDVNTLQTRCRELEAENAKLRAALEETKVKLDELSKPAKTVKQEAPSKKEEPVKQEPVEPKKVRSRKKS